MTSLDDRIRAGLRDAPISPAHSLERITERARAIKSRRRAAGVGITVAAAALVFPFAFSGSDPSAPDQGPAPADTAPDADEADGSEATQDDTVWCESWGGEGSRVPPLELDDVPDHLRLLWDDDIAGPPSRASGFDFREMPHVITHFYPAGCEIPNLEVMSSDSVVLAQVSDDTIVRKIHISIPDAVGDIPLSRDGSRTVPIAGGLMWIIDQSDNLTGAFWAAGDDAYWLASVEGTIADAEFVELAEAVRLVDGEIDATAWSGYRDVAFEIHNEPSDAPFRDDIIIDIGGPIDIEISGGNTILDLWEQAPLGGELLDINGQPGVLFARGGRLLLLTADGALVRIGSHGLTTDELLAIARSIGPVPAGDERLTAVWTTEFDEDQ